MYTITPDSLKAARFAFLDLTTSGQALARFVFQPAPDDQQNEREALRELAQRERRDPQDQADLVICDSLQRAGLLAADALTPVAQAMQHAEAQHA